MAAARHERAKLHAARQIRVGAASILVPARVDRPELLDLGAGSIEDARQNLNEMWRLNVLLGGVRALMAHIGPLLAPAQTAHTRQGSPTQTILDIGTGAAHFPAHLHTWARQRGLAIRAFGLDLSARNLSIAQPNVCSSALSPQPLPLLRADALALPFAPNSVDVVVSSLFMHHLAPDALARLLREASRVARRGIVMSDIVRGSLPLTAFRAVQPVLAQHELTRSDGMTSIRRAYTPAELQAMAREAGLTSARVHRHFPWRMTLVAHV